MPKKNSKPAAKPTKRSRKTIGLPRPNETKSLSRPTNLPRVEIVTQLSDTIAAAEELFHAHGGSCSCDLCCAVANFVGALRIFHLLVEIT